MEGVLWKWTNYWNGICIKIITALPFQYFLILFPKAGKHAGLCWKMEYLHITNRKRKLVKAVKDPLKYKPVKLMVRKFQGRYVFHFK